MVSHGGCIAYYRVSTSLEAGMISARTKAALAAAKRRGVMRASRSAAFLRRAAANGLRCRSADCWRRPAALSTQAPSPPSR